MMADTPVYQTVAEIEDVVLRFECCTYTPEEFVHARHLTVAVAYFARWEPEVARERMRAGLRKFIAHHGKNGYHVTITEFWLEIVEGLVAGREFPSADLVSLVNAVIVRCNDKNLIYDFYSRERIASPEARTDRLHPDLKPIVTQDDRNVIG
ncbi:MAG: hypothetical protein ACRD59_16795 [Candidatus Acidiferrales bacterium]